MAGMKIANNKNPDYRNPWEQGQQNTGGQKGPGVGTVMDTHQDSTEDSIGTYGITNGNNLQQAAQGYFSQNFHPSAQTNGWQNMLNSYLNNQPGEYQQSQTVTDRQNALTDWENNRPGEYQMSDRAQNAQNSLDEWMGNRPGEYQQSQAVTDAWNALQGLSDNRPQSYQSRYGEQLDQMLQEITNPEQFNYEFNGDALFNSYKDLYTQQGRQASMEAMGQAAGLTGGYGNSYAQQVGNQAYDQYLTQLYDRGMDLRDRAYQEYQDSLGNKKDAWQMMANQENTDYNRYRDTVGDWERERDYQTGRYDTESDRDYGRYRDTVGDWENQRDFLAGRADTERDFDYGMYRDTMGDWENQRDYLAGRYDTESDRDYNRYRDTVDDWRNNRDYYSDMYLDSRNFDRSTFENDRDFNRNVYENDRDYDRSVIESDRNFEEGRRQFDESLDWDKLNDSQRQAATFIESLMEQGKIPSIELLRAAGFSDEEANSIIGLMQPAQQSNGGGGTTRHTNDEGQTTSDNRPSAEDVWRGYNDDALYGGAGGDELEEPKQRRR